MPALDAAQPTGNREVALFVAGAKINGLLTVPAHARGLVIFAHATGRSRGNPRNHALASILNREALATFVCDLLTAEEEVIAELTGDFRHDVALQAVRLNAVTDWCVNDPELRRLPIGYFAAGSAAAAAIMSAVDRPGIVQAIVARGGRPDLAWNYLSRETVPTLLIAGERDTPIRTMNWVALQQLGGRDNDAWIVPRAGHLFLEPGALEDVGRHAAQWFTQHFTSTDEATDRPLAGT